MGAQRGAQVAPEHAGDVAEVLHEDGVVQAQLLPLLLDEGGVVVLNAVQDGQWIAGNQANHKKGDEGNHKERYNQLKKPF